MGTYKLSEAAQSDLIRIHQRGVRLYGEKQADQYFFDLIKRFEQLAEQPLMVTVRARRDGWPVCRYLDTRSTTGHP